MKTIERPQQPATEPTADGTVVHRGHIGRITAIAMTTGAVTALILALGVFAGATEPVTTGVVLLAFAASWALLGALAAGRTEQPQPWTRVPAVVMAALGFASLAIRPNVDQMNAVAWVWPIGLIALAVWMVVQSRRSMRSWARRVVLYPIFGLMIAGGIGAAYETGREALDRASYAAPGDLVDVGGHRLHINCTGTGSPTVVLEAGLGEPSPIMAGWIAPAISPTTRVCTYDRAGKGWSDPAPADMDSLAVVDDLHTLLERHGETGPFVLAGHSSGGVYVQAFAATYPDDVAGLVLLDAQPADALTRLPGYSGVYAAFEKASGLAPSAARFGLLRLVSALDYGSLPDHERAEERAFASTANQSRSMRDEIAALPEVMERARALTTLGDKPVIVVSSEQDAQEGWLPLQAEKTRLSTNSVQRSLPEVSHASLIDTEEDAVHASTAILDVVRSVQARATVDAPSVATGPDQTATPIARPTATVDQFVVVHGAQMHVRCAGGGDTTVVLIAGFESGRDSWTKVEPAMTQRTRVCSYDKFGTGTSDAPPATQTFVTQADDLHEALRSLGEPGPFVVVGHSFGGAEAVSFARTFRSEVRGLVLVDASPTTWQSAACAVTDDGSPGAQGFKQVCSMTSAPQGNAEHLDGPAAFAEVSGIETLDDMPMTVLTAGTRERGLAAEQTDRLDDVWRTGQEHWASLSSASRVISVDGTGHNIQIDQPAVVIEQVERLLP